MIAIMVKISERWEKARVKIIKSAKKDTNKYQIERTCQEVKILVIKPKTIITTKIPSSLINTWGMEKTLVKIELAKTADETNQTKNKIILTIDHQLRSRPIKSKKVGSKFNNRIIT